MMNDFTEADKVYIAYIALVAYYRHHRVFWRDSFKAVFFTAHPAAGYILLC